METRTGLSKVPEVTAYFWIIKVLCTTVGETGADGLIGFGLGLLGTTLVMGVLLAVALYVQFKADRYKAWVYWTAVVLISIVGTLVTDNLTDHLGVPLELSTLGFGIALIATFAVWHRKEGTLSIHSIFTPRREAYYWLAILFTFALGTAAGDLVAERYGVGYLVAALMFGGMIAIVGVAYWALHVDAVLSFWLAYILTRPFGASLGDWTSKPTAEGGLGLGTVVTNVAFLVAILATVAYLAVTKRDAIQAPARADPPAKD